MSNLKSRDDYVFTKIPDAYIVDGDTLPERRPSKPKTGVTLRAEDLALLHEMVWERISIIDQYVASTPLMTFPASPSISADQIISLIDSLLAYMPKDPAKWSGYLLTDKRPSFPSGAGSIEWECTQEVKSKDGVRQSSTYECTEMTDTVAKQLYGNFYEVDLANSVVKDFSASVRDQLVSIKEELEKHVEENVPLKKDTISNLLTAVNRLNYIWGPRDDMLSHVVNTENSKYEAWPCAFSSVPDTSKKHAYAIKWSGSTDSDITSDDYMCMDIFEPGRATDTVIEKADEFLPSSAGELFWRHTTDLGITRPNTGGACTYVKDDYEFESNGTTSSGGSYSTHIVYKNAESGITVSASGDLKAYLPGIGEVKTVGGSYIRIIKSISLCLLSFAADFEKVVVEDTTNPCKGSSTSTKKTEITASCTVSEVSTLKFDTMKSPPGGGKGEYVLECGSGGKNLAKAIAVGDGKVEESENYTSTPPPEGSDGCKTATDHSETTYGVEQRWLALADYAIIELEPHALPE